MSDPNRCVDDDRPADRCFLWRGVPLKPTHIVFDHNTGTWKVSSGAFDDPDMSVVVAEEVDTVECLTKGSADYGIVTFRAGYARNEMGQTVIHDPWPKEPAHALVQGVKPRPMCRKLAKRVIWVHRPAGHDAQTLPDPPDLD